MNDFIAFDPQIHIIVDRAHLSKLESQNLILALCLIGTIWVAVYYIKKYHTENKVSKN